MSGALPFVAMLSRSWCSTSRKTLPLKDRRLSPLNCANPGKRNNVCIETRKPVSFFLIETKPKNDAKQDYPSKEIKRLRPLAYNV